MGGENAGLASTTNPARVLDRVLDEVLTSADKWCQGSGAATSDGVPVPFDSDLAARFCMVGGVCKAMELELGQPTVALTRSESYWDLRCEVMGLLAGELPASHIPSTVGLIPVFNDDPNTTFEDVRLVLKEAREAVADA